MKKYIGVIFLLVRENFGFYQYCLLEQITNGHLASVPSYNGPPKKGTCNQEPKFWWSSIHDDITILWVLGNGATFMDVTWQHFMTIWPPTATRFWLSSKPHPESTMSLSNNSSVYEHHRKKGHKIELVTIQLILQPLQITTVIGRLR